LGVAPRRLWGWEPTEYHENVYEDGQLVGVRVTREPEFTPTEVELLLAHLEVQADIGWHGIPMSEATDLNNQFAYRGNESPRMDWAAKAIGDASDAYYASNPGMSRNGHQWYARKRSDN
jgi:hypothetical protein